MKLTPAKIFFGLSSTALILCVGWYWIPIGATDEVAGQIGDRYGALNALFTGIGLAGVAAGLYLQHSDREAEERAVIDAIGDEMEYTWEGFKGFVAVLKEIPEGDLISGIYPSSRGAFPIYTANASAIGKIRDSGLRKQFVAAYSENVALLNILEANEYVVEDYRRAKAETKSALVAMLTRPGKSKALASSSEVRKQVARLTVTMSDLVTMLKAHKRISR